MTMRPSRARRTIPNTTKHNNKRKNNMSKNSSTSSGGIGFVGLLTITFIVLKLCNVIEWSWWWVLSPIWITIGLCIAIILLTIWLASR